MSQPDVAHMLHQATKEQQDEVPSLIPYEPFIPIEAQNAQDLRATKSTISKQLDVMQHESISNLFQDHRSQVVPYQDLFEEQSHLAPLFFASYVIKNPGTRSAFMCKPCNKEGVMRHNFRAHHKTNKHCRTWRNG